MPCYQPIPAYQHRISGDIAFRVAPDDHKREFLPLPCGKCLECRKRRAREWVVRAQLETQQHDDYCWTTLTYDEDSCPPTLDRAALAAFLKRLRTRVHSDSRARVRFFASGEYGEHYGRPHYHAILWGIGEDHRRHVEEAWPHGFVRVDPLTPAAISYVCGYVQKKLDPVDEPDEVVDPHTGEVLKWQRPFLQMSRRPGIGAYARDTFTRSWRDTAIIRGGARLPVPRYLHNAWKASATEEEVEALRSERLDAIARANRHPTWREAVKHKAIHQQSLHSRSRTL